MFVDQIGSLDNRLDSFKAVLEVGMLSDDVPEPPVLGKTYGHAFVVFSLEDRHDTGGRVGSGPRRVNDRRGQLLSVRGIPSIWYAQPGIGTPGLDYLGGHLSRRFPG